MGNSLRNSFWQLRSTQSVPFFTLAALLAGCSSVPLDTPPASPVTPPVAKAPSRPLPALPAAGSGRGGYYQDDGPGDAPPQDLLATPDAEPKIEPYSSRGNRPYVVFGKTYTPFTDDRPYKESGIGSWYGRKYHGRTTSSGEVYDMYKMTAAHPTLPIPSYARVTSQDNGRQVIVRVNDRGPFLGNRVIDLSYTAALKLGYLEKGSGVLEVERLLPDEINRLAQMRQQQPETAVATQETASGVASVIALPVAESGAVAMQALPPTSLAPELKVESALPPAPVALVAPTAEASVPVSEVASKETIKGAEKGVYLQFGAYSRQANALTARARLLQDLSGVIPSLDAVEVDGLHRLHAGPYANRAAAQDAVRLVQQKSSLRPLIVER